MHSHWEEACNLRIATALLQCRSTIAISSFVFLNYSLPNSTNHLTKLNLILEMASECKILPVWWWKLDWKTLPSALVRFRKKKKGYNIQEKWFKIFYLRIASSQRIRSLLWKRVIFHSLISTLLSFSVKLLSIDGSIYIIYIIEISYRKFYNHYKSIHSVTMWLAMWHSLISPKPNLRVY